ncbi:hypothetical protein DFH05DRAFT_1465526 [Lentinula detonsa]|uniref:Protein SET n=1 Tax=Lentinula detonsa TaxID=2804962 RepID=A0A9W8PA06_9AGAR|nr:hypothetical protein DFH05DRAFT_1465526 [Lentinula detonsa]KAJ3984314.1 hypothetical protein F5890DRAFT_57012 [Lentinula detonsa]
MAGTKRASPGAGNEKDEPISSVFLSEEDAEKLTEARKDLQRTEIILERNSQLLLGPVYERRRPIVKAIQKFWPIALMNHGMFAIHAQHKADQLALSYLEDLWIKRDPKERRCFTIEFNFKENPYFTNTMLHKEYKYVPSKPTAADETPDADGLTPSIIDFSWEQDVKSLSMKIDWKDPDNALTKLYPREKGEDDDDDPAESGSFFNYFEHEDDPFEIGLSISNEIFPDAIDYFLGEAGDNLDSDDEEDDDDDADEIDLEQPKSKKRKV